jgi:hypothetical protein
MLVWGIKGSLPNIYQLKPAFRRMFLSADNGLPSLERPVIFGFPVRQFRENRKVRFNVEAEKSSTFSAGA